MDKKDRMIWLVEQMNEATEAYEKGEPYLTDSQWDEWYYELKNIEKELGCTLPNSPTQTIIHKKVSELKKVKHNHPMLSLDKTKNIKDIKSFIKEKQWIAMAKMDGLTCSLTYKEGKLVKAETRGNGIEGEDITHNAMIIPSIPNQISGDKGDELIVDGEIICTYKDFEPFSGTYKNPRNFASGSIRLLDSKECRKRKLTFVAWDAIYKNDIYNSEPTQTLHFKLYLLEQAKFKVVPYFWGDSVDDIESIIDLIKEKSDLNSYPIDGVVFKYDNITEYEAAGRTDHHFKGGLAYKFYDEIYSTRLRDIDWTMGRTGVLTPVAVFDPIEIDGAEVSRASLHNVSIMKETLGNCAYVGEPLEVYKSNMIIPQIYSAGPKYDYGEVIAKGGVSANDAPEYCPICHGEIAFKEENGITRAYCENPNCNGKLINRLDHFCGKKGLDIKGLSKVTLEKLINYGWLDNIEDIFKLEEYKTEWANKPGFGTISVNKILNAIEGSKKSSTAKFICAIGIPLIGKVASEALSKKFGNYKTFREAIDNNSQELYEIAGVGEVMIQTLLDYDFTEADSIFEKYIIEVRPIVFISVSKKLEGKTFVITGKLKTFKNRNEIKATIEKEGGKVTDSVSSKTDYLINNDVDSTSSKNLKAKKLNIPIITEDDFLNLIN
jgi:DNA ligase (NAD+)